MTIRSQIIAYLKDNQGSSTFEIRDGLNFIRTTRVSAPMHKMKCIGEIYQKEGVWYAR